MKSGELFAGVGGLGMAVDEVFGSAPAWFAEIDKAPSKVLKFRHPDVPNLGDVTQVSHPEPVDILAGGFPCQDVSLAGRRKGLKDGTRSGLWAEFARLIDEIRPRWVVIENVRGLLSASASSDVEACPWCLGNGGEQHALRALGAVLGDLAELGFDAEWTGVRASDVGAPHGRFRVFILAWPKEFTVKDAGSGRGRGRPVASGRGERTGADSEADRANSCNDGAPEADALTAGRVALLPTPVAQPSGNTPAEHLRKKPGREVVTDLAIIAENGLIETGGRLLPTPTVGNATGGNARRGGNRGDEQLLPGIAVEVSGRLLPTPGAYDGMKGGSQHPDKRRAGGHSVGISDVVEHALMPTPRATRGGSATETAYAMGGVRSNDERPQGVVVPGADWGPYEAAVARWVSVLGRPAPSPVRYDGKGGKPRLNPELTEWMMGWPAGWVTDPDIGLTRAEQLKACGNGVVPQQAAFALRHLLARSGQGQGFPGLHFLEAR